MSIAAALISRFRPTTRNYAPHAEQDFPEDQYTLRDKAVAKRVLDVAIAATACILLGPLLLLVALLLLVLQGRPILIGHRRLGLRGRAFPCLKFRTMVVNAEEVLREHLRADPAARAEWEASCKLRKDPRITPLGAVLRRSSIDELPQLFNVLRGDMSLVGPRPIIREEARFYGRNIVDYFAVRPGITGVWQVSGRNDIAYARRVELDVVYSRRRTLAGDLAILLRTVPAVLASRGSY